MKDFVACDCERIEVGWGSPYVRWGVDISEALIPLNNPSILHHNLNRSNPLFYSIDCVVHGVQDCKDSSNSPLIELKLRIYWINID